MKKNISASEKLIFALDVDGYEEAMKWVKKLKDYVRVFKVGKQLFTACGPNIVKEILKNDCKVFLDLKFHDIPNTVSSAVIETAKLGVSIITIHASGGRKMIEKTRKDVDEFCAEKGIPVPLIAAVTVLTSISEEDLAEIGVGFTAKEQVLRLAKLSLESGADAIVCSPLEISFLRNSLGNNFKIIAPGIRDRGTKDDQKRVMSASDAIKAGADYIVVGRPIRNAPDPISAAEKIIGEIAGSN